MNVKKKANTFLRFFIFRSDDVYYQDLRIFFRKISIGLKKNNFHRSQYQNDISYRRWYFEMSKFSYFAKKIEKKDAAYAFASTKIQKMQKNAFFRR